MLANFNWLKRLGIYSLFEFSLVTTLFPHIYMLIGHELFPKH